MEDAGVLAGDVVANAVLGIVADKTGYPQDMLDLDLDLEADLGIGTVKQAETFAAVRQEFDIPLQQDLSLRDYPTLESVIGFVHNMRSDLAEVGGQQAVSVVGDARETLIPNLHYYVEDADKMPRRFPVPALRPALDYCKPTDITLDQNSRVIVMMDSGGVGRSLVGRLQNLGVTVLQLSPKIETEALIAELEGWLAESAIQGVYWLPALDVEPDLEEMDLATWRELNRRRIKNLYTTTRTLYDAVAGPNTFLVVATRLGGLHGYGEEGASAPLGGAVVGFSKAYGIEQGLRAERVF